MSLSAWPQIWDHPCSPWRRGSTGMAAASPPPRGKAALRATPAPPKRAPEKEGDNPANTGNGGLAAIPLIAKLSAEQDGDNRDGNYFIGIRVPQDVLAADLEEGGAGDVPGLNHPVSGATSITPHTWHHAAVTYDGANWLLFLDGNLDASLRVGQPPRFDSIQHAALGSCLNSTGAPQGYFAGVLDEARIWNYARAASQIASNQFIQIRSSPGLLGRWSLD